MAVSDSAGRLLWVEGHLASRRKAEAMNFVEGAVWDEAHAGTNAPGTALALDHAVQIFSAEHFRPTVQAWTCAAAPIHDPATGAILGIVDVTGGDIVAHPHSLALVNAAARAAEAQLGAARDWRREAGGALWVPGPGPGVGTPKQGTTTRLLALGRDQAVLRTDGEETRLNRRHSEVMVILAQHPEGLTGDRLISALYDDETAEATVRVEVARLRRVLGEMVRSGRTGSRRRSPPTSSKWRKRCASRTRPELSPRTKARCCHAPRHRRSSPNATGSTCACAPQCSNPGIRDCSRTGSSVSAART
jgi:transcriptional regulator of acetoin/glycerol metabolism